VVVFLRLRCAALRCGGERNCSSGREAEEKKTAGREKREREKYMFRHGLDNQIILARLGREDLKLQLLWSAGLDGFYDWHGGVVARFSGPFCWGGQTRLRENAEIGSRRIGDGDEIKWVRALGLGTRVIGGMLRSRREKQKCFGSKVRGSLGNPASRASALQSEVD